MGTDRRKGEEKAMGTPKRDKLDRLIDADGVRGVFSSMLDAFRAKTYQETDVKVDEDGRATITVYVDDVDSLLNT